MSGKPIDEAVRALRELRETGDVSDWHAMERALDAGIAALTAAQQQGQAVAGQFRSSPDGKQWSEWADCPEGPALPRVIYVADPAGVGRPQPHITEVRPLYTASPPSVPVGWKLVPVVPTEEMVAAGIAADINCIEAYDAMLAAAPTLAQQPAASAPGGVEEQPVAWTDADMEKPCGAEVAFLRRLSEAQWVPAEVGGMLRHSARLLEHRATELRSIYDLLNVETGADAGAEIARLHALAQQPAADEEAAEQYRKGWEAGHAAAQQPAANPFVGVVCPECNAEYEATARQPAAVDGDVRELLDAMDSGADPRPAFLRLRQRFPALAAQQGGSENG